MLVVLDFIHVVALFIWIQVRFAIGANQTIILRFNRSYVTNFL
jgi:hypothetical protein